MLSKSKLTKPLGAFRLFIFCSSAADRRWSVFLTHKVKSCCVRFLKKADMALGWLRMSLPYTCLPSIHWRWLLDGPVYVTVLDVIAGYSNYSFAPLKVIFGYDFFFFFEEMHTFVKKDTLSSHLSVHRCWRCINVKEPLLRILSERTFRTPLLTGCSN